jgi:hypothetical protein
MIHMGRQLTVLALVALAAAVCVPVASARQTRSQAAVLSETFTIVAIDQTNRILMLKDKDGYTESLLAGPGVQRFNELKVGDKVTFRYQESVVYQIQKPGATPPPAGGEAAVTRSTGPKPGGTISQQLTATVTIQAIDLKIPSVTIKMDNGNVSSFKVEDRKNLEGFNVGDRVQITYAHALAISVE